MIYNMIFGENQFLNLVKNLESLSKEVQFTYNVFRKGKILVSTFVGLRRGEEGKTASHWPEEKMHGKVKFKNVSR